MNQLNSTILHSHTYDDFCLLFLASITKLVLPASTLIVDKARAVQYLSQVYI